jgi:hypothetical protein
VSPLSYPGLYTYRKSLCRNSPRLYVAGKKIAPPVTLRRRRPLPRAIQMVKGSVPPAKTIPQKGQKKGAKDIVIPVPERARKYIKSKEDSTDELEEDNSDEDDEGSISSASSEPELATQKTMKQKVCAESAVATETRQVAEVNVL